MDDYAYKSMIAKLERQKKANEAFKRKILETNPCKEMIMSSDTRTYIRDAERDRAVYEEMKRLRIWGSTDEFMKGKQSVKVTPLIEEVSNFIKSFV